MRRQLDNAFASQGLTPNVRLESDALEDLVHAARKNGMLALLNGAAALSLDVGDAIPFTDKTLYRQACLIRSQRRHHSFASRHIWDALSSEVPILPSTWARQAKRHKE